MPQNWYQKATVQAAMVAAAGVVLVAVIGLWPKRTPGPATTQPVYGDVQMSTSQGSTGTVVQGSGNKISTGIPAEALKDMLGSIDEARAKVQEKSDDEKQRSTQLAGGVQQVLGMTTAAARLTSNPELARVSSELKDLLAQFNTARGTKPISGVDDLRFRLAEATLANAEGRYDEALNLVTADEVNAEIAALQDQNTRVIQALRVRGDAFMGLFDWEQAIKSYEAVLSLRSDDRSTRQRLAKCLGEIGRLNEAFKINDGLVQELTRLVESGHTELESDLAMALNNRAVAFRSQNKLREAIQDYDHAIGIYKRLFRARPSELAHILAMVFNNRGECFLSHGSLDDAIQDCKSAIFFYQIILDGDQVESGRAELEQYLAMAFINHGKALTALGNLREAIQQFDRVIEIRERLVGAGHTELEDHLASAFHNRGVAHMGDGQPDKARGDWTKALEFATDQRLRGALKAALDKHP